MPGLKVPGKPVIALWRESVSVSREQFRDGITWEDWLERLDSHRAAWERRFAATALGPLRADYQDIPTPRYVLCFFDPDSPSAHEAVPVIAKACEQSGVAGGVDLRLFPLDEFPGLTAQYLTGALESVPTCAIFDRDWVQVGLWRLQADATVDADWAHSALRGFLHALRGQPNRPWHGHGNYTEHRWNQAEQASGNS
jgi:hypothetical protein